MKVSQDGRSALLLLSSPLIGCLVLDVSLDSEHPCDTQEGLVGQGAALLVLLHVHVVELAPGTARAAQPDFRWSGTAVLQALPEMSLWLMV